ncbi:MAG: hypothetical protein R3Y18_03685 [Bacillota bacterium]
MNSIAIWKNKSLLLQIFYTGIISIIILVISLINFTEAAFDVSRLQDDSFWFEYTITLVLGLSSFFITNECVKISKKKSANILRVQCELATYYSYITANDGLYSRLKEYLDKKNKERKLQLYINHLKNKRGKAKSKKKIDFYENKIKTAGEDVEFVKVNFTRKSINLIFSGFDTRDEDAVLKYKGTEQLAEFLLPALLCGLFITAMTLAFVMTFTGATMESVINLIVRLVCIGMYCWKGSTYAEYSILTVYYAALESRKGIVHCFFDDIGYNVSIKENPFYMYNVEKQGGKENGGT